MKKVKYVFVCNNMYNSDQIRRVRWYHKLFGFYGEFVMAEYEASGPDHFREAVVYFRRQGYEAQVMGCKLHREIV